MIISIPTAHYDRFESIFNAMYGETHWIDSALTADGTLYDCYFYEGLGRKMVVLLAVLEIPFGMAS